MASIRLRLPAAIECVAERGVRDDRFFGCGLDCSIVREASDKMATNPQSGSACPIGATPMAGGVNFSVYAGKADVIELLLFDGVDECGGLAFDRGVGGSLRANRTGPYLNLGY